MCLPPASQHEFPKACNDVLQALQKNPAIRPSAKHLLSHPWVQMHIPEVLPPPDQSHLLLQSLSLKKPLPSTVKLILPSGLQGSRLSGENKKLLTADFSGAAHSNQEISTYSDAMLPPSHLGIQMS